MNDQSIDITLQVRDLGKQFGSKVVLDGVYLAIPAGKIIGLSGANGAGKSVLLRILCGWLHPSRGEVTVMGKRIGRDVDFPPDTGALVDVPGFLPQASGMKNLEMLAALRKKIGRQEIVEAMIKVGLDPLDPSPVRTYSNGMRQRLGIAQAIMENPRLLILDEPTDAIDQDGWRGVYEYLIEMKEQGCAILLSSNKQDEIKILCDEAYVLEGGRLHPLDGAPD